MLQLTDNGVLPPGIHEASLEDIRTAFGQFQATDRRPRLFEKLKRLVAQLKPLGFVRHLIVNGSFVTSKSGPEDIDLIFAINPEILQKPEWTPEEYNALSSRRLRRQYKFDVFVVPVDSRIKGNPGGQKGVVRVQL